VDWRDILLIIGSVIVLLSWFGISPQKLFRYCFDSRRRIFRFFYFLVVSILTLLILYLFIYFPISVGIFDGKWGLLLGIVIYFIIGAWLPILTKQGFWYGWLTRLPTIISQIGAIAILIGYWLVSWPEWFIPLLMTCAFLVALIIQHIRKSVKKGLKPS